MIPFEYEQFFRETIRQAQAEGKSHSEFLFDLAAEAWKLHYPGNPQTKLESHTGGLPQPIRLRAAWSIRDLENDLKILEQKRGSVPYQTEARKRVEKAVLELSSLNLRLNDSAIQAAIEKTLKVLEAGLK
jgi:DNA polymerase III gamma/tau subunit